MKKFIKRSLILLISISYLYVEYYFRERLLQMNSSLGSSFNHHGMESLGRMVAAFGLAWLIFLVMSARNRLPKDQAIPLYIVVSFVTFVSFYHLQKLGVDLYVDAMSVKEKRAAVGAQTFKTFTYYEEKSGDGGYNPDGEIGLADKLMLSFLPWLAYDNDSVRKTMDEHLISAAKKNVKGDIKYHLYRYKELQEFINDRLYSIISNYIVSLNKEPSGVNYVLAPERLDKNVDELHWSLETLAVKEFRKYRRAVLQPYQGHLISWSRNHSWSKYTGFNGDYYTRTYKNARHSRLTQNGLLYGDWLYSPPKRTLAQEFVKKFNPFVYPVSKLDALFVDRSYKQLIDDKKSMKKRVSGFLSSAREELYSFKGSSSVSSNLLKDYKRDLSTIKLCERYETPLELSRRYKHTWNGKGHYFVQNHYQWRASHRRLSGKDKQVSVTMPGVNNWGRYPHVLESVPIYASKIEDMEEGGSITLCDPYRMKPVFNRYTYPLMMSLNKEMFKTSRDMVTYTSFIRSKHWLETLPKRANQFGFTINKGFNWRSKSAIARELKNQAINQNQKQFEKYLLDKLASISKTYDRESIRIKYQELGKKLPLWNMPDTQNNRRQLMMKLAKQPIVKAVIKAEYPYLYDRHGNLLITFMGKGAGKYSDRNVLESVYKKRLESHFSAEITQSLTTPESDFYQKQVRAFIVVPLAILLSTLFILLNAVNIIFIILRWMPIPSLIISALQVVTLVVIIILPMRAENEYTKADFYKDYVDYGSSSAMINITQWLQGSAKVFDGLNGFMGERQYRKGLRRVKRLEKNFKDE